MAKLEDLFKHQVPDLFRYFAKMVFDLMIGEPNNGEPLRSQKFVAHFVTASLPPYASVVIAIDLKNKAAQIRIDTKVNRETAHINMLQPRVMKSNLAAIVDGVCVEKRCEDMLLEGLRIGWSNAHKNTHFPLWVWGVKTMVACTKPEPSYPVLAMPFGVFAAPQRLLFMALLYYPCQVFAALGRGITIYSMPDLYVNDM